MVKGFGHLVNAQKQSFDGEGVLTMRIRLPDPEHRTNYEVSAFYQHVLGQVEGLSNVSAAGLTSNLPLSGDLRVERFTIEGRPPFRPADVPQAGIHTASAGYFHTLRIRLLKGRLFDGRDGETSLPVAILSESAVRQYWKEQEPVGSHIRLGSSSSSNSWISVIGVVADVNHLLFSRNPQPTIYLLDSQSPVSPLCLAVRTSGDPTRVIPGIRDRVLAVNQGASLYQIKSMEQVIDEMLAGFRVATRLMATFGLIAILLSAVGIYGTVAHSVSQQKREIGVRMALGARRRDVLLLFVKRAFQLVLASLCVSLPVAFGLTHVMSSMLFGVVGLDVLTFLNFTLLLGFIAVVAAFFPACEAARLDPIVALRLQ
jgi:putative ABC transport system permease protein